VAAPISGSRLRFLFFLATGGRSSNGRTPDSGYELNRVINRSDRCTYVRNKASLIAPLIDPELSPFLEPD